MNDKKPLVIVLFVFAAGIVLGFLFGTLGAGYRNSGELREYLEQVNRDLDSAVSSQREAAERAARLQAELLGITEHARRIEEGTRRTEARTESLAKNLGGIAQASGELADGISRAHISLEESRILLDELGTLVRGLPGFGGKEN